MSLATKHHPPYSFLKRPTFTLAARNIQIPLGLTTKIMGILNITPDSFSSDGLLSTLGRDPRAHMRYGLKLIAEGADLLDIGGESTRPGSKPVSAYEEIQRIIPVIRLLAKKTSVPISVDTYKSEVAKHALDAGAVIINTTKGASPSKALLKMIASYRAAIVLMHSRKTPRTMQQNIRYHHLINEMIDELDKSLQKCLETGIKSDRIIIDPGIGFAKTAEHNLEIIKHLKAFSVLKKPILIGTSRKSFIGKIINKEPSQRLWGTAASISASILHGAHVVRVHDVKEMRDVVCVTDAILNAHKSS